MIILPKTVLREKKDLFTSCLRSSGARTRFVWSKFYKEKKPYNRHTAAALPRETTWSQVLRCGSFFFETCSRNIAASKARHRRNRANTSPATTERSQRPPGSSKKAPEHRIKLKANSTYGFVFLELNCAHKCALQEVTNSLRNKKYLRGIIPQFFRSI